LSKLTLEMIEDYQALMFAGHSQREACKMLDIPRTTVQNYLARAQNIIIAAPKQAKILAFDLETSPAIAAAFGRHKIFLGQDNIIQEGGKILCFGWSWVGSDVYTVEGMTLGEIEDMDDTRLTGMLWDLFYQADAVVCHNAAGFDVPMLRARVIVNGFPPLPTVKVLDTLTMAKKVFRFPNNKLDSLSALFGLTRKKDAGGTSTWLGYMRGDEASISHMHDYCEHDVWLLVQVYLRLRSFGHSGSDFNAAHYVDNLESSVCPVCGSEHLDETGRTIYTAVSSFKEVRCLACGAVARTRQPLNSQSARKHIVVTPKTTG
jgi:hypothetical protein